MKTRQPTSQEIEELVSFLPRLYVDGITPIMSWSGRAEDEDGVISIPQPEYVPIVEEFYRVVSGAIWRDSDYDPGDAARMIESDDFVKNADLAQIKTMLTYCVRGERFCDGHWGAKIDHGHIRRLLQRLTELDLDNA